jgi:signal transduction histidine kinase
MKRQTKALADVQFANALAMVRSTKGGPINGLAKFRRAASLDLLRATSSQFANHAGYRAITLKSPFPKKINELPTSGFLYMTSFAKELAWLAGLIAAYGTKISKFVASKEAFERLYLVGDYSSGSELLNSIEHEFGFSCWLTQRRMDLLSQTSSRSARNRYMSDTLKNGGPPAARYLISWFGYRASEAVSKREFDRYINETAPLDSGLNYILYADSGLYQPLSLEDAAGMLSWSDVLPIIDRYQIMIDALQALISSDENGVEELDDLVSNIEFISKRVSDSKIERIRFSISGNVASFDIDPILNDMNESLFLEKYREVVELYKANCEIKTVERLHVALSAHIQIERRAPVWSDWSIDEKTIFGRIAADLYEVMQFSDEATDSRLRLEKLILNHASYAWASSLSLVLERQYHDERIKNAKLTQKINALRCTSDQPLLAFCLPQKDRAKLYLDSLSAFGHCEVQADTFKYIAGFNDCLIQQLPDYSSQYAKALRLVRSREIRLASEALEKLITIPAAETRSNEARLLLVECRLEEGDVAQACELAADLFIRCRYFGLVLPVQALISKIMVSHNEPLAKSSTRGRVSVSIIFDIYSRFVAADRDAERADSFNDVLRRYKVTKASELALSPQEIDRSQLIYFLRYICVSQVMDQSLILDGTRHVEDERLAILQSLIELSSEDGSQNFDSFKDEIREIRTKQVVKDMTLKLDQSKIYVNVDGIRRSIDVQLRETWTRYKHMLAQARTAPADEMDRITLSANNDSGIVVLTLNTPYSERTSVFNRMIAEIRDQFTLNKEFGLNSNLSANIRHGYVLRELRAPLVNRNLVTNRVSQEKGYHSNLHWSDRIDEDEPDFKALLDEQLNSFSAKIDEMIDHINRVLLRIRTDANPDGLFNYNLSESALAALEPVWGAAEQYDDFMNAVIDAMWTATEHNLKNVRGRLLGDVLQKFVDAIDELGSSLESLGLSRRIPAMNDALLMAKADMRAAIERVASWFTLSAAHEYADFDLEIAFQAGIASVKSYYADLSIVHTYHHEPGSIMLLGWSLPAVARLFFQILDNAAQHAGKGRRELSIDVTAEHQNGTILIKITNDLPDELSRDDLKVRIGTINADYGQAKAMDMIGEEGGSGYPKIWKLLKADLRRDHDIHVSLEQDKFKVEILLNSTGLACIPS